MPKTTISKKTEKVEKQPRRKRAPVSKRPLIASEPTQEEIERRAYELCLARGGAHGHDLDDWLQAERELREQRPSRSEK